MTIETQNTRDTSRCRITSVCGFSFCSRCGGNDYDDRPFACVDLTTMKGSEAMATPKTKTATTAAKKAEPPPQMQREDRRIVADKIADVYDDTGYIAPWTDELVAQDLGVPRAWIAEMRDFMFGPANENPELAANRRLFSEWSAAYENLRSDLAAHAEMSKQLRNTALDLQRRAEEIGVQQNRIVRECKL
ncbi:hypothetical protein [uncultured Martelella sp.]|uniref:hypothetical protein n=1 Tax=uncultured Martelella sp. TaxID=392331 RepID=UPI0029C91752|nr:hypothetical protein [uncultured Martelella sp.]